MAFRNIPPNGFPAIPDIEDLEAVVKDVGTLKTTTAGLAEDVSDLEEQKANQITIALPFNPETEYEVGDLVYYNGLTYRCTNAHTGEWDADDFAGTTIANELATLKNGLTGLIKKARYTYTESDIVENCLVTDLTRNSIVIGVQCVNRNGWSLVPMIGVSGSVATGSWVVTSSADKTLSGDFTIDVVYVNI